MTLESGGGELLSRRGRMLVLVAAFLGWLCAGFLMSITSVAMQPAALDLLGRSGTLDRARFQELTRQSAPKASEESSRPVLSESDARQLADWRGDVQRWFAWLQCAFLFGAAAGGLLLGALGDRIGRVKGMAVSILTYSVVAAATRWVQRPEQLLVLWFVACLGIGGMWPNGVALVSEVWSTLSRPLAAGLIGTAANIGIFLMSTLTARVAVTPDHWRWVMDVAGAPAVVGLLVLAVVPESPKWLAGRDGRRAAPGASAAPPAPGVFRHPYRGITLLGIALATIPLAGGWGSANWVVPWAGEVGDAAVPPNPFLKAQVSQSRALAGIVGSLMGGWVASVVGRRRTYFLNSLICLGAAQFTFWFLIPTDGSFLAWVALLGFFSGIYFGWLPLFLPELFPTEVRSTGAGVCFNFGRILTAVTVFATGALVSTFHGDYAAIGRVTSLIYVAGLAAAYFAPESGDGHNSG